MSQSSRFSKSEISLLVILSAVNFSHIVDFMIMMPLGPQLMRILKINPSQFSLLVSAYTFCAGATGLLSAFFLDFFDRKRSLIFFFSGFCLGTLACGLSNTYETLLIARSLTGAFGGVLGSQVFAIVGDVFLPEKRGTATGIVMGAFSLASILGVPFSLYLAAHGTWQTPLIVLAGISGLVLALIIWKAPSLRSHMGTDRASPWSFIKTVPFERRPLLALILLVLIVFGQFIVVPFLSPSLVANAGLREDQLPLVYLIGGTLSLFASPMFGRWVDRSGPIRVMLIAAPFSMIPFLLVTHLGPTSVAYALFVCALFFFLMGGRMVPVMTLATGSVQPVNRGAFMSLSSSVQQFAAALAAMAAGHIVTVGEDGRLLNYNKIGYLASGLTIVALCVAFRLRKEPAQVS